MERVRYNLLYVINTLTFAVACNSAVWAVLLCVSTHQHCVPFLGIRPSNVPSRGSLEHIVPPWIVLLPYTLWDCLLLCSECACAGVNESAFPPCLRDHLYLLSVSVYVRKLVGV